ncbi:hypothetical protein AKJ64_03185 [candidate division MSBL1 archaeon SCGC-AAA259E17]|uniref:Uncharacterized protein n=1 Tax=candidate division MSBL1 archaeon SCGC-AAA259E17 TaxID=1698263 RepID=A0A133UE29_9EURY|nr:hypothetical protein AKJ64_03185 [candidate division MSBL1 archaeon SCGC-AAA259E17]
MSKWFDKEMKRLTKKFDEMIKKMMTSFPRKQDLKSDKNSKTFEKKGPGFHMKVEMFNLTMGPEDSDRNTISEFEENKKAEAVEEENKPGKLALRRFKEKKEEDEE